MSGRKPKSPTPGRQETVQVASAPVEKRGTHIYWIVTLLSLVGLADSIYLTVKHLTGGIVPCTVTGSCEQVLNSSYATVAGFPLAGIGALAYFSVFSLSILAIFGNHGARKLLFYIVALMFAVSIYLFILQAFVIHAFCQYCLLSAAITLLLMLLVSLDKFYFSKQAAR